jgi:hypothetical protein
LISQTKKYGPNVLFLIGSFILAVFFIGIIIFLIISNNPSRNQKDFLMAISLSVFITVFLIAGIVIQFTSEVILSDEGILRKIKIIGYSSFIRWKDVETTQYWKTLFTGDIFRLKAIHSTRVIPIGPIYSHHREIIREIIKHLPDNIHVDSDLEKDLNKSVILQVIMWTLIGIIVGIIAVGLKKSF